MSDILTLVDDAKKSFNVLEAARGRSYPQDIISVYTDAESAYQVNKLEKRINDSTDNDELEALAAEQDGYKKKVKDSILTFHLRGINPGQVRIVGEQADEKYPDVNDVGLRNRWSNFALLAAHIVSVTDADGNVDEHKWTYDDVETLQSWLPDSEFDKIHALMLDLTFSAALFESSVNADFSLA